MELSRGKVSRKSAHWIVFTLLLGAIAIVSCSTEPSEQEIQTAIAQTVTARIALAPTPKPTFTPRPTETATPTATPQPTATPTPITCTSLSGDLLDELDGIFELRAAANTSAKRSPYSALSEPVTALQEIKQQTHNLDAPECAADELDQLLFYMDSQIELYLARMDQDSVRTDVYYHIADHQKHIFLEALESLDLEEEAMIQVHYYIFGYASDQKMISYWEHGEKDMAIGMLPWTRDFEAQEGETLSLWSLDARACAILADGELVDIYIGQMARCSGHAD
jgi:hypothetical protein